MNKKEQIEMDKLAKTITTFAEDVSIPAYLRWGLQVLFIVGTDSNEKSNAVAGLASVGERAFNSAIAKIKASGDLAGAKKLEADKQNMLKIALSIDFAGALASVLKSKLSELSSDEDTKPEADATNNVIVGIVAPPTKPQVVLPTNQNNNPFAGRN